ncbi:putative trans-2,3-dihydro-3-hydroxyanthranilate isomerase [Dioscorea sansibarensis]
MATRVVRYAVVDAFTDTAFKGNPAAVCFLEDGYQVDDEWMQSVAKEFNISETAFLTHAVSGDNPRFNLRWFTPVAEVDLCGHATLAAAHFLLSYGLVKCDVIEFATKSGILTATKVSGMKQSTLFNVKDENFTKSNGEKESFSIELNFPVCKVVECDPGEIPSIPETLNGASVINVTKKGSTDDIIVEVASGHDVVNLKPRLDEIRHCAGRGLIVTGPAPPGSGYDIFSRFFCPKMGIDEDPVCGSAHCALAPYWSKKLGKNNLVAYMASPRGGRLDVTLDENAERVYLRGKSVVVMEGSLLA